jgi:hypothetical protein
VILLIVLSNLTLEKENKEFSPQQGQQTRQNKKNLTEQYKNLMSDANNNVNQTNKQNKKLKKNSSQNSIQKTKKSFENIKNSQNVDKVNFKPSISFQDENFCYKTRSTVSDEEKEVADYLNEINTYASVLKDARKTTIKQYLDDVTLKNSFHELLKKTNNTSIFSTDIKTHLEIRTNLEYLSYPNKLNEKQLLVVLINLANLMLKNKKSTIESFVKFLGIPSYINILNYQNINQRIYFVYLFIINQVKYLLFQLISDELNSEILEDLILFQLFIYVTKLSQVFSDWEIKAEIALIIVEIINKPSLLKVNIETYSELYFGRRFFHSS